MKIADLLTPQELHDAMEFMHTPNFSKEEEQEFITRYCEPLVPYADLLMCFYAANPAAYAAAMTMLTMLDYALQKKYPEPPPGSGEEV